MNEILEAPRGTQAILTAMNTTTQEYLAQVISEWIFLILQVFGGQLGHGLLLVTFAIRRKQLKRCIVVTNFCFTWLFSSISYSLV